MPFTELRREMGGRGISQKKLAEQIGMDEKSMVLKLSGRRQFTHKDILNICGVLNKTLDDLFSKDASK